MPNTYQRDEWARLTWAEHQIKDVTGEWRDAARQLRGQPGHGEALAADVADFDQALAQANERLSEVVVTLRADTAGRGERQAMADLALTLAVLDRATIGGLLLVALKRLAGQAPPDG